MDASARWRRAQRPDGLRRIRRRQRLQLLRFEAYLRELALLVDAEPWASFAASSAFQAPRLSGAREVRQYYYRNYRTSARSDQKPRNGRPVFEGAHLRRLVHPGEVDPPGGRSMIGGRHDPMTHGLNKLGSPSQSPTPLLEGSLFPARPW